MVSKRKAPIRVLDTNILVEIWHGKTASYTKVTSLATARTAAQAWLKLWPSDGILTPIRLEFLGGVRSKDELKLADEFLSQFKLFDQGRVLPEDWKLAERFARRVRVDRRPRGAIDCLIVAICERLHAGFRSEDTGLPKG